MHAMLPWLPTPLHSCRSLKRFVFLRSNCALLVSLLIIMKSVIALLSLLLLLPLSFASPSSPTDFDPNDSVSSHHDQLLQRNGDAKQELFKFGARSPEDAALLDISTSNGHVGQNAKSDDAPPLDPLVQENFQQLEESLKLLSAQAVDNKEDLDIHKIVLNTQGERGSNVINLLHKYAHQLHQKLQEAGEGEDSYEENHSHLHKHSHDQEDTGPTHSHMHAHHLHEHSNVGYRSAHEDHDDECKDGSHDHGRQEPQTKRTSTLPEEIEEENDLQQYGFEGQGYSRADQTTRNSYRGIWLQAMGCSLLVSMASLVCLLLLPFIVSNGKPSRTVVDALASFGAGAMLGDAFIHQLPHAFGSTGFTPHSHDAGHHDHVHGHAHSHGHKHSPHEGHAHGHSLEDLSVGLAVLGGIILFFIVEKIVRRVEELSAHGAPPTLGHALHHHKKLDDTYNLLDETESIMDAPYVVADGKEGKPLASINPDVRKRSKSGKAKETALWDNTVSLDMVPPKQQVLEASGTFVMGYLNLFSDAVHNFTDGMALGTAFLLHGTMGGWSRTLFLLAHELPQEVGDFGILVRSGFGVFKALTFNFLSALVAMAGTALALMLGGSPGQSSLIEGFTAGGFIYIAVAGVMPDMHNQGSSFSTTLFQLTSMVLGMGVAVAISLAE